MSLSNYIIGIDTSCDDTSVGIINFVTGEVKANVVCSETEIHAKFGGVVPELASRAHVQRIYSACQEALAKAEINPEQILHVAVTTEPGLVGSLMMGQSFAQGLALQWQVPLKKINHVLAHLYSPFISKNKPQNFLGLVVSGGHTSFYNVCHGQVAEIGYTLDDAVGEAFDKVAKMLKLSYPGGPQIERLAESGEVDIIKFPKVKVKKGEEYLSFSGLKTASKIILEQNQNLNIPDFCAGFQKTVCDYLASKTGHFLKSTQHKKFALSGGVACNKYLRATLNVVCQEFDASFFVAKPEFCADNGVMIAYASI